MASRSCGRMGRDWDLGMLVMVDVAVVVFSWWNSVGVVAMVRKRTEQSVDRLVDDTMEGERGVHGF
jgi:hypothetical protein